MAKTIKIVDVDGKKVHRTTTIVDESAADLQEQIAGVDRAIAATTARYITPLEIRRKALEAKVAELAW